MKKLFVAVILLTCAVTVAQAALPNLILANGRFMLPRSGQFAQAIAITHDRITAVGTNEEMIALNPNARRIDLRRHLVIPGFNDAHVHFGILPAAFVLGTTPDSTFPEVKNAILGGIDETPPDIFIFGTIGTPAFLDPNATRTALDAVAPGRKVMLTQFTGHGAILNTAAFAALGLQNPTDPIGGRFERNANGQLTGKVFEYANYGIDRKLASETTDEDNVAALRQLSEQALRFGITTLQIMPNMDANRFVGIVDQAKPRVRVRNMRIPITTSGDLNLADGHFAGSSAVKWILDGTPIEQGAALRVPYPGTGLSGIENFTGTQIRAMLADAIKNGEQPLLHAAGDRAISTLLKVMLQMGARDWPPRRLRIEHGDGLQSDMMPAAVDMGVVVVQNPAHLPFRNFYPAGDYMLLKTLVSRGVKVAIGSDGPLDPFLNLQMAVTHPVVPDERLSLHQALIAYTAGSAFAEKLDDKGQIAAGQLADLAVLSQDLFHLQPEQYVGTESILTIVGGRIVFNAGVLP
jgi:predicted amidohydrolase YtcJ